MPLPRTPSFRLDRRRALVTGASSGIGQGAAVALAEAGAHVVCAARGMERLKASVDEMVAAGFSADSLALDVGNLDAVREAIETAEPFDILVNAAGLARHSAALDTKAADYDAVMDVNLRGAYFLSQAVARRQKDAGIKGTLIHISSQMAHVGGIDRAVYSASKHALEGMVKSMAIEWGPMGIRINSICPTFVRTPLTEPTFADPDRVAWIEQKIKLGRVGTVEDIMGAVVYLASDASSLVTGTSILVDGGWTAG